MQVLKIYKCPFRSCTLTYVLLADRKYEKLERAKRLKDTHTKCTYQGPVWEGEIERDGKIDTV